MAFKYKEKYGNYINGKFVDPIDGQFFDNITPINGKVLCKIARSNEKKLQLQTCLWVLITLDISLVL